MRKKIKAVIVITLLSCLLCACSSRRSLVDYEPGLSQIQNICELSTLECYYHNVAKSGKKGAWGQANRTFWIEYTGIARIGIDMSDVTMEISGNEVSIYVPEAKLLSIEVKQDTFDENSYITDADDGMRSNKITAEDQTHAIADAQATMTDTVNNNKALFASARERAKTLIENYIKQIGEACGKTYVVKFVEEKTDIEVAEENE